MEKINNVILACKDVSYTLKDCTMSFIETFM